MRKYIYQIHFYYFDDSCTINILTDCIVMHRAVQLSTVLSQRTIDSSAALYMKLLPIDQCSRHTVIQYDIRTTVF